MGRLLFDVKSQSEEGIVYSVDLGIGLCSCTAGENGRVCKHQVAAAEYSATLIPQVLPLTSINRRWIAEVALGLEKVPNISFFEGLMSTAESTETTGRLRKG